MAGGTYSDGNVWRVWLSSDTTSTTAVWSAWTDSTVTYTATAAGTIWYAWNASTSSSYATRPQLNPAEVEARRKRDEEARRKRESAHMKAEALLKAHLSDGQRESFEKAGHFEVISPSSRRRYKVARSVVYEVNEKGEHLRSFCIHPRINHPEADNMLAKKLMIEAEESEFLRIANVTNLRRVA
jgi:hypothetical protein